MLEVIEVLKQMQSHTESQTRPFHKLVFKPHTQKRTINKQLLAELDAQPPQKTIACQRCRKLRKKCSKHLPSCFTCVKMGEKCEYSDSKAVDTSNIQQPQQQSAQPQNYHFQIRPPQQSVPQLLPSLKDQLNYTHNSKDVNPSSAVCVNDNNKLPPIRLPPINHAQLQHVQLISQQQQKQQEQSKLKKSQRTVDIQNALLSTLINLGKENLLPTELDSEPLMIPREDALKYTANFFDHFYTLVPFLHKQQILKSFQSANLFNILNPPQNSTPLEMRKSFQLYLILTIGFKNMSNSNLLSKGEIESHSRIFSIRPLTEWIIRCMSFRTHEDIECMVLLVIDSYFTKNCLSTSNITNLLTGLILRYHYHRKLSNRESKNYSELAKEQRYRLFWSTYIIDRTVANYLNKPVTLSDELISTPLPSQLSLEDFKDEQGLTETLRLIIKLKQLEGDIFNEVHSVAVLKKRDLSIAEKQDQVLTPLRNRLDEWLFNTTGPQELLKSRLYFSTMYYNSLTLVYRPSYLIPHPEGDSMVKLSKSVLQNLTYTYNLTLSKSLFSVNWLTFFRILVIFKTLLRCLQHEYIVLEESKTEINLCVEILKNFENENNADWSFIKEITLIFQRLLKLSFQASSREEVSHEISYGSSRLEDILKDNSVGCRLDDRIEEEYDV